MDGGADRGRERSGAPGADPGQARHRGAGPAVQGFRRAGGPGLQGPYVLEGLDAVRSIPGVTVHLYGAKETAPRRVLGHVTLVGVNHPAYFDVLLHRADTVRKMIILKESKR